MSTVGGAASLVLEAPAMPPVPLSRSVALGVLLSRALSSTLVLMSLPWPAQVAKPYAREYQPPFQTSCFLPDGPFSARR